MFPSPEGHSRLPLALSNTLLLLVKLKPNKALDEIPDLGYYGASPATWDHIGYYGVNHGHEFPSHAKLGAQIQNLGMQLYPLLLDRTATLVSSLAERLHAAPACVEMVELLRIKHGS